MSDRTWFFISEVVLAVGLAFICAVWSPAARQNGTAPKMFQIVISCVPAQDLLLAVQDNGTIQSVPDYVAECRVQHNGKLLYEGSYSNKTPSSKTDAIAMEQVVLQEVVKDMRTLRNEGPKDANF